MRHAIVSSEFMESDIRPPGLRRRFREMAVAEASRFFPRATLGALGPCPACEQPDATPAFEKHGCRYDQCPACGSVFASLRPTPEAMSDYYAQSEAGRVRTEYLAGERNNDIGEVLRTRVDWVSSAAHRATALDLMDFGTSYVGVLAEIVELDVFANVFSWNPAPSLLVELLGHGVQVRDEPQQVDVVTAFEQLEHQADPRSFIATVRAALKPGGVMFLTTRSISGFDLQVLWDRSPYIFFPEHLNLFSIEGLQAFLEHNGFEIMELSTPGHLDIEFVRLALAEDPSIDIPRHVRYLLEHRGAHARRELQTFLQKTQMSSHVRVVAQFRGEP